MGLLAKYWRTQLFGIGALEKEGLGWNHGLATS